MRDWKYYAELLTDMMQEIRRNIELTCRKSINKKEDDPVFNALTTCYHGK
tara:strand:- start:70474 stop:70623 length:150 start_codon:yes stop_codon:yes gene_type:complete